MTVDFVSAIIALMICFVPPFVPLAFPGEATSANPEKLSSIRRLIGLEGGATKLKDSIQRSLASIESLSGKTLEDIVAAVRSELEISKSEELMQDIEAAYDKHLTDADIAVLLRAHDVLAQSQLDSKMDKILEEIRGITAKWGKDLAFKAGSKKIDIVHASLATDSALIAEALRRGEDVNSRDSDGTTALIWATRTGNIRNVRLLLDQGANVNATTNNGQTALMTAAASGNDELIGLLLSKGADPDAKNDQGINAYQLAELLDLKGAMSLLKKKTKDTNPVSWSIVVASFGDAKDCLPVLNYPTVSSKKIKCLKMGEEVVPEGVQTTEGWELIGQPVTGWVPPKTIKPIFRVSRDSFKAGAAESRSDDEATPVRKSQESREPASQIPQESETSVEQSSGGKWWKGR